MKKIIRKTLRKIIVAAGLLALCILSARAQTFGNLMSLSGTNYSPILLHYATQSNLVFQQIQAQTLIVTNINTNQAITVSYGSQILGGNITNGLVLTTITTNFPASAGWTNGATWIYTIPAYGAYVPVTPFGYLAISNGAFTSGTCTNGVGLQ